MLVSGCGHPSAANNQLRVENAKLQERIEDYGRQKDADNATIRALQAKSGNAIETLPPEKLDKLFTAAGLKLGRLTGGDGPDDGKSGDVGIEIEAVPLDQEGQALKAAGGFTVDLFDLTTPANASIGHWVVSLEDARRDWSGGFMMYGYVLKLPWQKQPVHEELTLKVTFKDELTGREFSQQKVIRVHLPTTQAGAER